MGTLTPPGQPTRTGSGTVDLSWTASAVTGSDLDRLPRRAHTRPRIHLDQRLRHESRVSDGVDLLYGLAGSGDLSIQGDRDLRLVDSPGPESAVLTVGAAAVDHFSITPASAPVRRGHRST